jgi:hypothetical protein
VKKLILIILLCAPGLLWAQQVRTYSVHVRTQVLDTTGSCNCPQDGNASEYDNQPDCNSLSNAMVTVYADTVFLKSYYTDETGYCPVFNLPYGKYRLMITEPDYATAKVLLNFAATDKYKSIEPARGTKLHYSERGTTYFLCLMLSGNKKTGVKIVPKK